METRDMSKRENKPSIGALAFILRHKELWPKGFVWDYNACTTCAMGIAQRLWPEQIEHGWDTAKVLGMSRADARRIFEGGDHRLWYRARRYIEGIRPENIADLLDEVLTR
jgi:hypothetical protein